MMDPLAHLQILKAKAAGIRLPAENLARARALRGTTPGFDRAIWRDMCERGWLGLCLPRAGEGRAARVRRFCDIATGLGAVLAPEPLIQSVMAVALLPPRHLPDVLAGARIVLPAWQESPGSLDPARATVHADGCLTGQKRNVAMADGADAFLVTLADGAALVARDAPGVTLETQPTADGGHAATLRFADAPAERLDGNPALALDLGLIAAAAYLTGVVEGAIATLADPASRPWLDSAQSFVADFRTQLSLTRAVVRAAAAAFDEGQAEAARQATVSRAMLRAADAAMTVTRGCVRFAGGTGETDAVLFLRKAQTLADAYGSPAAHRARCRPAGG